MYLQGFGNRLYFFRRFRLVLSSPGKDNHSSILSGGGGGMSTRRSGSGTGGVGDSGWILFLVECT